MTVKIDGMDALVSAFTRLSSVPDDETTENMLLERAEKIKAEIVGAAPQGSTGNLKRSIVAKKFKNKINGRPAVFVAVDYRIAPHAQLVERGTRKAAARPFFRPVIDRVRESIGGEIKDGLKKLIERAW